MNLSLVLSILLILIIVYVINKLFDWADTKDLKIYQLVPVLFFALCIFMIFFIAYVVMD